jgi:DNA-binding winged helix-turn-helix (wHTH) protein/Flp pilus assembly protein TadD
VTILRFGVFELDRSSGDLRKRGFRTPLRAQTAKVLLALADRPGQVVSREELRARLWPDGTFVDFDRAINKSMSELRRVLGDSVSSPRFIETLSRRGYRFLAPVASAPEPTSTERDHSAISDAAIACTTGRYLWNRRTVRDLGASIGFFEQAVNLEPTNARAHAGLADASILQGIWGLQPPSAAFGAARRSATQAIALAPQLAEGHTSIGEILKGYEWDWPQAERRYGYALTLDPHYAPAHHCYAQLLVSLRRYDEAVSHIEQARRADPVSPAINSYVPYIYLAARRYEHARREGERAVGLEPHAPLAHWQFGRALLFSKEEGRAVKVLERAAQLSGRASMWVAELCYAQARAGDRRAAAVQLSELTARATTEYISPYDLAIACIGVGEHDAALDYLEDAYAQRVMRLLGLGDPEFDVISRDKRYQRLVGRLGLPQTQ